MDSILRDVGTQELIVQTYLMNSDKTHKKAYCRTGFDSDGLIAAKIGTKNDRYYWISL